MFYKIVEKIFKSKGHNKNKSINKYFESLPDPSAERDDNKYYIEMQLLAFQLMRYLKMDEKTGENTNQGRYNWTYFKENLKREDLYFLINKLRGALTFEEWQAIHEKRYIVKQDGKASDVFDFEKEDIGDSYMRVIYKPKDSEEIKRVVKKMNVKQAIEEINSRIEIDYLKTELIEYKEGY